MFKRLLAVCVAFAGAIASASAQLPIPVSFFGGTIGCADTSKHTFSYTGSDQSITVPSGCGYATVKLWGAGGGACLGGGGGGAFISGTLPVTSGHALTVVVGKGGAPGVNTPYGGGGTSGGSQRTSGGGRSAIIDGATELVTAGAGGAGGNNPGGAGGVATGFPGNLSSGGGGTQSAGGAGIPSGSNGSLHTGGPAASTTLASGGGSGYYGGGGANDSAGGGGGSSFIANLFGTSTQAGANGVYAANGGAAGGAGDPDYVTGIGVGGARSLSCSSGGSASGIAGNGLIVITFSAPPSCAAVGGAWNPADKGSSISLSNSDKTAIDTNGGPTSFSVRGTVGKASGGWFYELHDDLASGTNYVIAGIATASANITTGQYIGGDAFGWGYDRRAFKYNNGLFPAYGATWTTGDVIGVLYNVSTGTVEFFLNGVSQGVAWTDVAGTVLPAISLYGTAQVTGNFSGPFAFPPACLN